MLISMVLNWSYLLYISLPDSLSLSSLSRVIVCFCVFVTVKGGPGCVRLGDAVGAPSPCSRRGRRGHEHAPEELHHGEHRHIRVRQERSSAAMKRTFGFFASARSRQQRKRERRARDRIFINGLGVGNEFTFGRRVERQGFGVSNYPGIPPRGGGWLPIEAFPPS